MVEREVDRVLLKFGAINEHAETVLRDLINHIESLKKEFEEGKTQITVPLSCHVLLTFRLENDKIYDFRLNSNRNKREFNFRVTDSSM